MIRFLAKCFGQYCEDEGNPNANWKQVTTDEFRFRCCSFDHVTEKSTVHPNLQVEVPTMSMKVTTDIELWTGQVELVFYTTSCDSIMFCFFCIKNIQNCRLFINELIGMISSFASKNLLQAFKI